MAAAAGFVAHRNLLFTVAYEMLGSAADAEDVLRETWPRWAGVDLATVVDPRAFLVLETLGPTERAVFVLRDVFAVDYDETAGRSGRCRSTAAPG